MALFTGDQHVQVEATWGIYQRMIAAYREPDRTTGKQRMVKLIADVSSGVPGVLREIITLGRTLNRRAADVLAYFDRPGTSNGTHKRSTADSSTSADQLSGSATSPTTSPGACSSPEVSDPDYTLVCEEPEITAQESTAVDPG